jgi:hypothetical protein
MADCTSICPFFAADDIINYFEDNSIFSHQRPGDRLSVLQQPAPRPLSEQIHLLRGEIIRYYQKLKPYVLGITETPYPSSDPYTINTKFDFVSRYPQQTRTVCSSNASKHSREYCHEFFEGDITIEGILRQTRQGEWGIIYVKGNVRIGGRIPARA